MTRYRSIISSGSSSDESPTLSKPTRKSTKMADQSSAEDVDLENISLKDLFTQINSMKTDIDSGLDKIKTNMESLRLEIQHDMKMMKTDIEEVKRSVNRPSEEIEEMKPLMSKQREDVDDMNSEILLLKEQVKKERERNTRLEQYTRRENIRLLNVKETEDENIEALFKKVLTEMGVEGASEEREGEKYETGAVYSSRKYQTVKCQGD